MSGAIITEYANREEWLAARRNTIGASELAAILGLSPWQSAFSVWAAKTNGITQEENAAMFFGSAAEPAIIEWYRRQHQEYRVEHNQYKTWTRGHLSATPDGFVKSGGVGLLECKTSGDWAWDELPEHYYTQVQAQMYCTGLEYCVVAALFRGNTFVEYDVEIDVDAQASIGEFVEEWWERHIIGGEEPVADGAECTRKALKKLYGDDNGETILLPSEAIGALERLAELKAEIADLSTNADAITNRILQWMGPNTYGSVAGWRVSYKTNKAGQRRLVIKEEK